MSKSCTVLLREEREETRPYTPGQVWIKDNVLRRMMEDFQKCLSDIGTQVPLLVYYSVADQFSSSQNSLAESRSF